MYELFTGTTFYCKGCNQTKPLSERASKYGKCKECEDA